jgi:hypothetical protein
MSKKFEQGDRVILVGKELIPTKDWPVWGSKHSCVGTVDGIGSAYTNVQWDNGRSRTIGNYYLQRFTNQEEKSSSPNIDPNLAFLHRKWRRECTRGFR